MVEHAPKVLSPGQVVATPGALAAARESGERLNNYIDRHLRGDGGDLVPEDHAANATALQTGARILSAYVLRSGVRIWIITEAVNDAGRRESTTVLLPDEY